MKTHILFDLDGTITDSIEGITNSIQYSLKSFGMTEKDAQSLRRFLGPPLKQSFMKFYGFSESKADQAVAKYREYFQTKGIYENKVYPGIPHLLESLSDKTIVLATAKPQIFAQKILDYFALTPYFSFVGGCTLNGKRTTKSEVISYVLSENHISPDCAIMVGDREDDVIGARNNHVDSIGVLYGYGGEEELMSAGATYLAKDIASLLNLLRSC